MERLRQTAVRLSPSDPRVELLVAAPNRSPPRKLASLLLPTPSKRIDVLSLGRVRAPRAEPLLKELSAFARAVGARSRAREVGGEEPAQDEEREHRPRDDKRSPASAGELREAITQRR